MRADAYRNHERILVATRQLLEEKGFLTQMDDVAERAGVGVGTLYRHFATKDALFGELVKQTFEGFQVGMQAALDQARAGRDPFEALSDALVRNSELAAADRGVQDALLAANSQMIAVAQPTIDELLELTSEVIELARAAGSIRADAHVGDIPMIMAGVSSTQNPLIASYHPEGWRRHLQIAIDGLRPLNR
ncbi:MAG TPA: helix-turn-helix domain-containing protein [Baekduia sp.]|nr:helix-turn-helix domain-containing protein [Baekduia sp.]